jgi:chromosome segregation ATPase
VDTPRTPITPARAVDRIESTSDQSLERGFVASLRWLVAEGDARGVRRIAVELRALRDALATLDETRAARDESARRAAELDRELQAALAVLGPGTAVNGNGTLVQRLARLRERLAEDTASRHQLTLERDAWRAMCTLLTQTRARVHELLDETERERDELSTTLEVLRARVGELMTLHDDAARDATQTRAELAALRERLTQWSGTVERALEELVRGSRKLADDR